MAAELTHEIFYVPETGCSSLAELFTLSSAHSQSGGVPQLRICTIMAGRALHHHKKLVLSLKKQNMEEWITMYEKKPEILPVSATDIDPSLIWEFHYSKVLVFQILVLVLKEDKEITNELLTTLFHSHEISKKELIKKTVQIRLLPTPGYYIIFNKPVEPKQLRFGLENQKVYRFNRLTQEFQLYHSCDYVVFQITTTPTTESFVIEALKLIEINSPPTASAAQKISSSFSHLFNSLGNSSTIDFLHSKSVQECIPEELTNQVLVATSFDELLNYPMLRAQQWCTIIHSLCEKLKIGLIIDISGDQEMTPYWVSILIPLRGASEFYDPLNNISLFESKCRIPLTFFIQFLRQVVTSPPPASILPTNIILDTPTHPGPSSPRR